MAGRFADIHSGERERLSPAMPIAWTLGKAARWAGVGGAKEENCRNTIRAQLLQYVGRAGEVVAVKGVEHWPWAMSRRVRERRSELGMSGRVGVERDILRCRLPGLLQAAHAGGNTHGMAHDSAAGTRRSGRGAESA